MNRSALTKLEAGLIVVVIVLAVAAGVGFWQAATVTPATTTVTRIESVTLTQMVTTTLTPSAAATVTQTVTQPITTTVTQTVTQPVTTTVTAPAVKPVKLRIGTAVLGDYGMVAPIAVALEKGFFAKYGLDVEFIPFPGGPRGGAALTAGEIDVLSTGVTDLYVLKDKGVDVRVIGNNNEGIHMTLVVAKDVNKLEDLKGKVIGVTAIGAFTWHLANALAERMGWQVDKDVKIVALGGFDAQVAALKRGEIAAFVWGDFGAVAEALGVGKVLVTFDEVVPGRWQDQPILVRYEFAVKNPEAINNLILAYMEAWRYIRLHPDEAANIIAKKTEVPVEAIKRAMALTKISIDGRIDLTAIENMRDFLYERGVIKTKLDAEEYIVRGFVPVIRS
jgi:ABC-type nitrate/sulfonate/bicarbonate transport system substrate-binding protein